MNRPRDGHVKQSKSERERQIHDEIVYVRNLKFDTNQHVYEIKTA